MGVKNLTFVDGNQPQCDSAFLNSVRAEINNIIASIGLVPTEGDLNQLGVTTSEYAAGSDFYVDSGAADAYVLSAVGLKKTPSQYFNGMRVRFRPVNTNTGASTVNVAGLGVQNIKLRDGTTDPSASDIEANVEIQLTYDGTNFRIEIGSVANIPIATKSEMEAETANRIPDAAIMIHHPGVVKAWVNFTGTGSVTINDSFNVPSITDNGVGLYTINLSITMANAAFAPILTGKRASSGQSDASLRWDLPLTTTTIPISTGGGGGGFEDATIVTAAILGEVA